MVRDMDIKDEKFVAWSDAKKILEKKAKEKELGYEQKNALEHLRKFAKMTQKSADDLFTELGKIERLKERQRVAITSLLPKDDDELRLLFSNEIVTISDEDKKKIISLVKKFS
jgi:DNA-directed RNA polymerase subunit F